MLKKVNMSALERAAKDQEEKEDKDFAELVGLPATGD